MFILAYDILTYIFCTFSLKNLLKKKGLKNIKFL